MSGTIQTYIATILICEQSEFTLSIRPAQAQVQSDLFYDYRTNVDAYPKWQSWLREKQPRLLVIWGKIISRSTSESRNDIGRMCRKRKFTFSMQGISPGYRCR